MWKEGQGFRSGEAIRRRSSKYMNKGLWQERERHDETVGEARIGTCQVVLMPHDRDL